MSNAQELTAKLWMDGWTQPTPELLQQAREILLRREAENETLKKCLFQAQEAAKLLATANVELLEALKLADALLWGANMDAHVVEEKVRAAIQKHGGQA